MVNNLTFDNGERIATTKQIKNYKEQMQSMGINVVIDKKGKVLTGDKAAELWIIVVCSMKLSYRAPQIILPDCEDDIKNMQGILKLNEINFATKLKSEDIIAIAELYVKRKGELYEIDVKNILYDTNSYVTNEPVWYVDIISKSVKEK